MSALVESGRSARPRAARLCAVGARHRPSAVCDQARRNRDAWWTRRAVVDTKWKRLKGAIDDAKYGIGQADIYQMMAYAHVYQCQRILLLYPHHEQIGVGPGSTCVHQIIGSEDNRIGIESLSLAKPRLAPGKLRELVYSHQLGLPCRERLSASC